MSERFYVGDMHLGHRHVAGTRGFFTKKSDGTSFEVDVDRHDSVVINSIIDTVPRGSTLILMGDNSIDANYNHALSILSTLKEHMGYRLELIPGNHDRVHPLHGNKVDQVWDSFANVFDRIQERVMLMEYSRRLYFSHFPVVGDRGSVRYAEWRWPKSVIDGNINAWSIHAHTHQETLIDSTRERHICVSWDVKRRPLSETEIRKTVLQQVGKKFTQVPVHWGEQEKYRVLSEKLKRREPLVA